MSTWSEDDAKEWLGGVSEESGRELLCPQEIQDCLLASFTASAWTSEDIPLEKGPIKQADLDLWESLIDDEIKSQKIEITKADRTRFRRWFKALAGEDDAEDGDPSVTMKYTPSKKCIEDMREQGAESYQDIIFGSTTLFLGKPASKNDLEKAEYAVVASKSQGGRDATKFKWKTFDSVLKDCKRDNTLLYAGLQQHGSCNNNLLNIS